MRGYVTSFWRCQGPADRCSDAGWRRRRASPVAYAPGVRHSNRSIEPRAATLSPGAPRLTPEFKINHCGL